jgi:hypothetical protein
VRALLLFGMVGIQRAAGGADRRYVDPRLRAAG